MVDPQEDESLKRTFAHWLFGQESNTVALYLILIAMGYGGYQAVTVWVPAHLSQIQAGYKEIAKENREVHKDIADRTHDDIEKLSASFEKAIDRTEKAFQNGLDAGKKVGSAGN